MAAIYELYDFILGDQHFRFTSSRDRILTDNDSFVYEPKVIGSSDIEYNEDIEKNRVKIRFPITDGFAQVQLRSRREQILYLVLKTKQGVEEQVLFRGRLDDIEPDYKEITLTFISEYTNLNLLGARKYFQRTCPYTLYAAGCNLNKDDFAVRTTISEINKLNIKVRGSFESGAYNLGMIKHKSGDFIGVEKNSGGDFTLLNLYNFEITTPEQLAEALIAEQEMNEAKIEYEGALDNYNYWFDTVENMSPDDPDYADAVEQMELSEVLMLQKQALYDDSIGVYENSANWVWVYLGCDKIHTTCKDKFNNLNNFGGFPFMPAKNPTSRSLV